jgi:hypothetical protein
LAARTTAGMAEADPKTADTAPSMALLLRDGTPSRDDRHLAEVLDFFGIPCAALPIGDADEGSITSLITGHSKFSVLTTAPRLAEALRTGDSGALPAWLASAASVFVYGFQLTDACRRLLRQVTGDSEAEIRSLEALPRIVSVASDLPELCGPMSGIEMQLAPGTMGSALSIRSGSEFKSIISGSEGHLFAGFVHAGVPFFADASQSIVRIRERSSTCFDVRKSFAGAVPLVMYLKWQFRDTCWMAQGTSACLIIDDPLLRPRYGWLKIRELLQLIDKHTFTTTIAFIPWNWRRTNSDTVATLQQNSEKLSVCVHGCDHTGGEFAARAADLLDRRLKTARSRMASLRASTGLRHDQVMVFPQGKFSPEVGVALKGNGFVAAVNTEVAPTGNGPDVTTIADLWSIANIRYGSFPIFSRRYIAHGIENFAFDGLLGKPCFIVGHHDVFREHANELTKFVRSLNSLNWRLCWRTLGDAVRRSYAVQRRDGQIRVKIFAEEIVIENNEHVSRQITVLKEEPDIGSVKGVTVNHEAVGYDHLNGNLQFVIDVPPKSMAEIRCTYHERANPSTMSEPISYRVKVAARRYFSELRDNYLSPGMLRHRLALVTSRLVK